MPLSRAGWTVLGNNIDISYGQGAHRADHPWREIIAWTRFALETNVERITNILTKDLYYKCWSKIKTHLFYGCMTLSYIQGIQMP